MPLLRKYCVPFCVLWRKFWHRFYFKNIYTAYAPQLGLKLHKSVLPICVNFCFNGFSLSEKTLNITGFLLFCSHGEMLVCSKPLLQAMRLIVASYNSCLQACPDILFGARQSYVCRYHRWLWYWNDLKFLRWKANWYCFPDSGWQRYGTGCESSHLLSRPF